MGDCLQRIRALATVAKSRLSAAFWAWLARRPWAALPLRFQLWLGGKDDGALPHTLPKELRPFGIPTMAFNLMRCVRHLPLFSTG